MTSLSPGAGGEPVDPALAQRLSALHNANDVRTKRKNLKRDLKAGRRTIESVLRNPPDYVLTAKIIDLLLELPKYGRVRVDKILTSCGIPSNKRIDALTSGQRAALAAGVTRHAPGRVTTR